MNIKFIDFVPKVYEVEQILASFVDIFEKANLLIHWFSLLKHMKHCSVVPFYFLFRLYDKQTELKLLRTSIEICPSPVFFFVFMFTLLLFINFLYIYGESWKRAVSYDMCTLNNKYSQNYKKWIRKRDIFFTTVYVHKYYLLENTR